MLSLLILTAAITQGQESSKYNKLKESVNYREGYILDSDSNKVNGLIKDHLLNDAKKYTAIVFVHLDGEKKKYYPSDIKGFGYSMYKFASDNASFYEVVQSGKKVTLFKKLSVDSWSAPGAPGMPLKRSYTINEDFYVKRDNEKDFKLVRKKKFIEEFSEYFKDCEKIVSKIQSEEYTHKDIKQIVSEYNYCK